MEVLAMLNQYAIIFTAIMACIALIFLVRLVQVQKEIKNLKKKYTALTVGVNGENLSEIVELQNDIPHPSCFSPSTLDNTASYFPAAPRMVRL